MANRQKDLNNERTGTMFLDECINTPVFLSSVDQGKEIVADMCFQIGREQPATKMNYITYTWCNKPV